MMLGVINKRGIAPVLAVAFITLGVIIGVVLLWIFAQKSINRGQDIIDPDCFTIDIRLNSCVAYGACSYWSGNGEYEADILVKRGVGRANLTGIRFSFEDWFGRKGVYDFSLTTVQLEELQSLQFADFPARIPVISVGPHLVRAIPLVGKNRDVCPIASEPVTCSIDPSDEPPPLGANPGQNALSGQCCQCAPFLNYSECYPGNDINYPIVNGFVLNGPNGPPAVGGVPPGNSSVCCSQTPEGIAGSALPSYFNDPSNPLYNPNLQTYWNSNSGVYGSECPSYNGLYLNGGGASPS